jgi:parallel beta-helix repeat protein
MPTMKNKILLLLSFLSLNLVAQADLEKKIQTQFILAEDGDVITLPAGKISLSNTLWLDAKKNIIIQGAGQEKTILSWKNQTQGAEGIKVTNSENVVLQDFTMEDSKGDLLKTQGVHNLTFKNLTTRWNGKPKKENGAYGLYPVQCIHILIENCTAFGASDAGIYVGQSDSVWVTKCTAESNVAGIEIENTTNAWVFDNLATNNTGGILVFDLPDLPKTKGGHTEVYNNRILNNNYRNFAPKGNIVGQVPAGTGVMVLATNDVNIHDNTILDNKTASCSIISYYMTEIEIKDKNYNPYPSNITIRNNIFSKGKRMPTLKNKLGKLFFLKFGKKVPHILYDGIQNPEHLNADGSIKPQYKLCIFDNENGSFANLKADKKFKGISRDLMPYKCKM